jgi:CarD family transcriptional regulator
MLAVLLVADGLRRGFYRASFLVIGFSRVWRNIGSGDEVPRMSSDFSPVDDVERATHGVPKESMHSAPETDVLPEPEAPDAFIAEALIIADGEAELADELDVIGADDVEPLDDEADASPAEDVKPREFTAPRGMPMKRGMDEHRRLPDRLTPPPRPLADEEDFAEGDHVVYPTHGVGKVERIAVEDIAGHRLELIHITFEENRMKLRVPVAKARSAGLRKLATRKIFDEALAVLKGRARIKRTMWSRRAQEYEAKINSGDPMAIAEVGRDLHRNAGQPDQSFSERQIYEAAMDRLAAELAALDSTDKNTAAIKLANFLKTLTNASA